MGRKRRAAKGPKTKPVERECQPDAAGCDIGAREIFVAVPADPDENPVRKCGTFTGELNEMAKWLVTVPNQNGGHGIDGSLLDSGL